MRLFIVDTISETIQLDELESKHISKVLRLNIGDTIYLTQGDGTLHEAKIENNHPKKTLVRIINSIPDFEKRPYFVHIAFCPTKHTDRTEWFLEKATEIGVDKISLLTGEHSERKNINNERCQKIIHSAVKQSLKAKIPTLEVGEKVLSFLEKKTNEKELFMAHCNNQFTRTPINQLITKNSSTLLMIGPEGDFSAKEIALAEKQNFKGINLSSSRLRAETAAVSVLNYLGFINL